MIRHDLRSDLDRYLALKAGLGHERQWSRSWTSDLRLEYQYEGAGDAKHALGEGNASYRPNEADGYRIIFEKPESIRAINVQGAYPASKSTYYESE